MRKTPHLSSNPISYIIVSLKISQALTCRRMLTHFPNAVSSWFAMLATKGMSATI